MVQKNVLFVFGYKRINPNVSPFTSFSTKKIGLTVLQAKLFEKPIVVRYYTPYTKWYRIRVSYNELYNYIYILNALREFLLTIRLRYVLVGCVRARWGMATDRRVDPRNGYLVRFDKNLAARIKLSTMRPLCFNTSALPLPRYSRV